ncbi:MAG: cytochrome P450 [Acidimicrobiales bacterium]|jgi:cytochrome P450
MSGLSDEFNSYVADPTSTEPYDIFARMRVEEPALWSEPLQAWVMTRWPDVTAMFEATDHFGPLMNQPGTSSIFGRALLQMSGTEHRRKEAIIAKRIRSPKRLESDLDTMINNLVAESGAALPLAPSVANLRTGFTEPVPLGVIAALMDMVEAGNFRHWYNDIVSAGISNVNKDPAIHAKGLAARDELFDFVTPSIEERRGCPGDELLSDFCSMEFEGERLTDDEVRSFTAFLLSAGIETTDRASANLIKHLILEPEQWRRLREDPSLVSSAVTEILRYRPPVQGTIRLVLSDYEIDDTVIPEGAKVMGFIASANHDPSKFDDPTSFDVGRFVNAERPNYTPIGPVRAFGAGAHTCTGSLLAKLEMERTLEYLIERFDHIDFAGDVPVDTGLMLRSPASLDVRLYPA